MTKSIGYDALPELIEPYDKGGYYMTFSLDLPQQSWNDHVVAVIGLGQRIAYEWRLFGDINDQVSGWSTQFAIAGVTAIEWYCEVGDEEAP